MLVDVRLVPHGRPAAVRLRDTLAELRGDDPLARASVVVPRSWVGLSLRRLLASGELDDSRARHGVANVAFTTLPRLADELGAARVAAEARLPLTDEVLRAAVRAALADDPGVLRAVADHPATEQALVDAWRSLRDASPAALARIATRGARPADVVRLVGDVSARLAGFADDRDLVDAAVARLRSEPAAAAALGPVVLHLPERLGPHHERLVRTLAGATTVAALLGLTGDERADADTVALAERLAGAPVPAVPVEAPVGTAVISAPGADTEVLAVLRDVAARVAAGTPLERMAVAYGSAAPYARLLRDACTAAGLPVLAPAGRRLSQTVPGRTLLGALELPARGWRRDDVLAWLATAPVLDHGREVRAGEADDLSRRAGITSGRQRWAEGLERLAAAADHERATRDDDLDDTRLARLERRAGRARRLADFVERVAALVEPTRPPTTWRAWTSLSQRLLSELLGGPAQRAEWPAEEQAAHDAIVEALHRLGELDALDPHPTAARFTRALTAELDAPAPQTARFGAGVLVGPYRSVVGLDLDVVYVLGVADGTVPPPARDDALLPDDDRLAGDGEVPLLAERALDHRRLWLASLAAAPERVLSWARADQRTGREQRPARWLLDAVGALAGAERSLYARDLEHLGPVPNLRVLASHTAAVRADDQPVDLRDLDLRALLRATEAGTDPGRHWLVDVLPGLADGFARRRARRLGRYDRFEGRVRVDALPSPVDVDALAPTSLERYATCPRQYLLRSVLGVVVPDLPEEVVQLHPLAAGSIVHLVMERFVGQVVATGAPPDPAQRWTTDDHRRLDEVIDGVFAEFEALGVTGHRVLWRISANALRRDLHSLLDADSELRASRRSVPSAVELGFGPDRDVHVEVPLADGRTLRFKGFVDRVDRTAGGGALVLDYKHARPERYRAVRDDPVARGRLLQLPLYGLAARAALGVDDVEVGYWFTTQAGRFAQEGYVLDPARLDRFHQVVHALVEGIEAGDFPARPIDAVDPRRSPCEWCDHAPACTTPRQRAQTWRGVRAAAELAPLVAAIDEPWPPPDGTGVDAHPVPPEVAS